MNEKTLLIGALAATVVAAGLGVYKCRQPDRGNTVRIAPVPRLDSARLRRSDVPIRLTARAGTDLRLVSVNASAALEDPLALTELHLVFENPELGGSETEGTFRIVLPPGASVSRFATKRGDTWQEGEVVEKQGARRSYEESARRGQSPALLEQAASNEFSARVFPIPPRGKKEIIVAYSEVLEAGAPYVLPLAGLPTLDSVDVDARAWGGEGRDTGGRSFGLHQRNVAPAEDFVVDGRALPRSSGLRNGAKLVARVVPFTTSRPDPIANVVVLVDTSASRALGIAEEARLVERVLTTLSPEAKVTVACFDQEVVPIYDGTAQGFDAHAAGRIVERGALGASDFQAALAWAGEQAKRTGARRVVLVGDGVATAGETDGQKIRLEVEKLRGANVERIDAIAVGGLRDDAFLRTIVRGVLDRDGTVLDAALGENGITRRLGEATSSGVPVNVEGATWFWPRTLDGLQAGDEVIIHAETKAPAGTPIEIAVGEQHFTLDLRTSERPLVERAWAHAKIRSLLEAPTEAAQPTRERIVELGTKYRVVSPFTSMLVLESDADYAQFGIRPQARSDILTVQGGRVVVRQLAGERQPEPTTPVAPSSSASAPGGAPPAAQPEKQDAEDEAKHFANAPMNGAPSPSPSPPAPVVLPTASPAAVAERAPKPRPRPSGYVAVAPAPPAPPPRAPVSPPIHHGTKTLDRNDPWGSDGPRAPSVAVHKDQQTERALEILRKAELAASGDGSPDPDRNEPAPSRLAEKRKGSAPSTNKPAPPEDEPPAPYEGRFKTVIDLLGTPASALAEAKRWHAEQPTDLMALVALGEAFEASGDPGAAARAYGSILELYPSRAELRRFAGERLERVFVRCPPETKAKTACDAALRLAIDTYSKAAVQRPDHPSGHHLYGFALLKHGEYPKAFEVLRAASLLPYDDARFPSVDAMFHEDLGLVAAAWARAEPRRTSEIQRLRSTAGGTDQSTPTLRFVLVWEADAIDVDLHVSDGRGARSFARRALSSGGQWSADVTRGFGPEYFVVSRPRAYPYAVEAHSTARGQLGFTMGKLELIEHDGKGNLRFDDRPYLVMADRGHVELGRVEGPNALRSALGVKARASSMK